MLYQAVMRQSIPSQYFPIWLVLKKPATPDKQKWSVVVDYKKLNDLTIDAKSEPKYLRSLRAIGKMLVFFDPRPHVWRIRLYAIRFERYPCQCVMENLLLGNQTERSLVYMDDILIYSPTIHDHTDSKMYSKDSLKQI